MDSGEIYVPRLCRNGDGRAYATYPGTDGAKRKYFGKFGTIEAEERYRLWIVELFGDGPEACHFNTGEQS